MSYDKNVSLRLKGKLNKVVVRMIVLLLVDQELTRVCPKNKININGDGYMCEHGDIRLLKHYFSYQYYYYYFILS